MARIVLFALVGMAAVSLEAAKIGSLTDLDWTQQAARFFTLQDPSVRYALAGSLLLGCSCGLLGAFLLVRKLALVGDTLSHAVLPGVALGFLWAGTKDNLAIFVGATLAGLLGTWLFHAIRRTTHIKEDASLGLILAGFYGVGVLLITIIQGLDMSNKAGLDRYLFGQAAALGPSDVLLMAIVAVLAIGLITIFFRPLTATAFDADYARSVGLPTPFLFGGTMLLLAFAVVVALKAVGVVLVSAMLIIPPATGLLLTDRFHRLLLFSAGFGMFSGAMGAFLSFLAPSLPTGPLMVMAGSTGFVLAFLLAPRHGLLPKLFRQRGRRARIARENVLKAVYRLREMENFTEDPISLSALATVRRESIASTEKAVQQLTRYGLANWIAGARDRFTLTEHGWLDATRMVRNHRLWELYLTHAAQYSPDHVHEDAEVIEHMLGEKTVRDLERRLDFPRFDPHGKPIPGPEDMAGSLGSMPEGTPGYSQTTPSR